MSTASEVLAMLRRHYLPDGRPPGGIFAPEIQSPDGKRRADLIWVPTTLSGGRGLVGHEVKVSRADVLTELADPQKMDPWGIYCSRWWLVVSDPSFVDGLEVPETWGVMAPPSGRRTRSMTVIRPAPELRPHESGPGYARVASWLFYRQHEEMGGLQRNLQYAEQRAERAEQRERDARASALTGMHASPYATRLGRILHQVEKRAHAEHLYRDVVDEDVVEALLNVARVRNAASHLAQEVESALREARTAVKPFERVAEALAKVNTPAVLPKAPLPMPGEETAA